MLVWLNQLLKILGYKNKYNATQMKHRTLRGPKDCTLKMHRPSFLGYTSCKQTCSSVEVCEEMTLWLLSLLTCVNTFLMSLWSVVLRRFLKFISYFMVSLESKIRIKQIMVPYERAAPAVSPLFSCHIQFQNASERWQRWKLSGWQLKIKSLIQSCT